MGFLYESVEAEHDGHHYSVRSTASLIGCNATLYVDGRRLDWRHVIVGTKRALVAEVSGLVIAAEVRQGFFGTRYRLFVGDDEVPLHVEPGTSAFSVSLPAPLSPKLLRP